MLTAADGTAATGTTVGRGARVGVRLPVATSTVHWYVDGHEVVWFRGKTTVVPAAVGVPRDGRTHTLTARAVDRTDAVRDPELAKRLRGELSWKVAG